MTTLSVVIIAKDEAQPLDRCLYALSVQTRPPDEIIVVDNGSMDDTAVVARKHGVRVIRASARASAAAKGFDAAMGDVIATCGANARLPANWLEHIETVLREHPDANGVTGPSRPFTHHPVVRWLTRLARRSRSVTIPTSNLAIRRSAWLAIGPEIMERARRRKSRIRYDKTLIVGVSSGERR